MIEIFQIVRVLSQGQVRQQKVQQEEQRKQKKQKKTKKTKRLLCYVKKDK